MAAAADTTNSKDANFHSIKFGFDSFVCNNIFAQNVQYAVENVSQICYLATTYYHDFVHNIILNNRQVLINAFFPPRAQPKIDHFFDAVSLFSVFFSILSIKLLKIMFKYIAFLYMYIQNCLLFHLVLHYTAKT